MAAEKEPRRIGETLEKLFRILEERKSGMRDDSYVALLYRKGEDAILKKIGEEAGELLIASKGGGKHETIHEMVDLWFHCMVLISHKGFTLEDIAEEFGRRAGISGLEEKRSRKKD